MMSKLARVSVVGVGTILTALTARLLHRSGFHRFTISNDMETIWFGNKRYEFMCYTYSDDQRGAVLNKKYPVKAGACIGKIDCENLYIRELKNVNREEYLAVTGDGDSVDIFKRIP